MIKGIIAAVLGITILSGCSFGRKPEVAPVVVERRTAPIKVFHPPLPDPVILNEFKWKVLTPELLDSYLKDLKAGKAPRVVWYAITPEGYEVLAGNVAVLRRYIKEQQAVILYYRSTLDIAIIPDPEPEKISIPALPVEAPQPVRAPR